jgi:hypothetical protein
MRGFPAALRRILVLFMVGVLAVMTGAVASAHEHREVGEYGITVGFLNEPALVDEPNGLSLRVETHEDEAPVEGLAGSLQAEVRHGGETKQLELRAAFGDPGLYVSDFIPTATGAYTFHITGEIEGMPIDEEFTSGPETFSEVESKESLAFPAVTAAGGAGSAVDDAQDTADSARTLAIAGLVVGVLGLAAGATGLLAATRARSARAAEGRVTGDVVT